MNEIEQLWQDLESELSSITPDRDNARIIISDILERERLESLLIDQLTLSPEVTQDVLKDLIPGLDIEIISGVIVLKTKEN